MIGPRHPVRGSWSALLLLTITCVLIVIIVWQQRQHRFEQTQHEVSQAAERLSQDDNILAEVSRAQRDLATFVKPSVVHVEVESSSSHLHAPSVSGSGWIWNDNGLIVTAHHVVSGSDRIHVVMHDGSRRRAEFIAKDPQTDIAILKMSASQTIPATRAELPGVHQGDMVFAFGSPLDFSFSVTRGLVSGLDRRIGKDWIGRRPEYESFIQIDAPLNPGSSGGPITNHLGHVVAMSTSIASPTGDFGSDVFSGIALAIPLRVLEHVVPQLIEEGRVARGFLGVTLHQRDTPITQLCDGRDGWLLTHVASSTSSAQAGLHAGDVLWSINSSPTSSLDQVRAALADSTEAIVMRSHILNGDPDRPEQIWLAAGQDRMTGVRGVSLNEPLSVMLDGLGAPEGGVLVGRVLPHTAAARAGLQRGDLLLRCDGASINSVGQWQQQLAEISPGDKVHLEGWRPSTPTETMHWTATLTDRSTSQP